MGLKKENTAPDRAAFSFYLALMKMKPSIFSFSMLLLATVVVAQTDSTYQGKAGLADVANDDPGLFLFMMFILFGFIAIILTLTILLLLAVALTSFLVFCGVLSVAVLNGLYHRSFTKGALLFTSCAFALAGGAVGATASLVMKAILRFNVSPGITLLIGLLAGRLSAGSLLKRC